MTYQTIAKLFFFSCCKAHNSSSNGVPFIAIHSWNHNGPIAMIDSWILFLNGYRSAFGNSFDSGCCFGKLAVRSHEISSDGAILVRHSLIKWHQSCMPVKNCCVVTESSGWSAWTRVAIWKAIIVGREGPRGSCGSKALDRQIIIVG